MSESEMLRRVARAICKSKTCEGTACCQWPAQTARRVSCPVEAGGYDHAARDAIAALREPTQRACWRMEQNLEAQYAQSEWDEAKDVVEGLNLEWVWMRGIDGLLETSQ